MTIKPPFDGAAMKAARDAKVRAQAAQAMDLGPGLILTPDLFRERSVQGAGWKLQAKGQPDRWFANPDAAKVWLAIQ